ncbi:hypothetical protein A9498_03195 [Bacillus thuringiensis serovar coreanensis]|nr:hypothetical protein A9498_03195 [Bacillus thuringiensis serovar coreanensis]
MNKFIMSIMLSIGVIIPLSLHSQTKLSQEVYKSDKTSQVALSAKELKTYRAVDPRRGLIV